VTAPSTKVRQDVEQAKAGTQWIKMIIPDEAAPGVVAGSVAPSNGICRSLGFTLAEEREIVFNNRVLRTNHWVIDPGTGLT
jgi:hypothetical protein